MNPKELLDYLLSDAGLDDATKARLAEIAANEKVAAKAANLVQKTELDNLTRKTSELEESYAKAKNYQEWYDKHYSTIVKLQQERALYEERYGALDAGDGNGTGAAGNGGVSLTADKVNEIVQQQLGNLTRSMSDTLIKASRVTERHLRNKRNQEVDWQKLQEFAINKTNGDIEAAYDLWDAPNREAEQKANTEAEIKRRVEEELAKRATQLNFPAGADGGGSTMPSPLMRSRGGESKTYNRNAVIAAALSGKES